MNSKSAMLACVGSALVGVIVGIGIGRTTGGGAQTNAQPAKQSSASRPQSSGAATMSWSGASQAKQWNFTGTRGTEDPIAAVSAANDVPSNERYAYLESVYTAWGEQNGEAAARWAMENLKGARKSDAFYYIADGWAESDPAGAAEWFNENTTGEILEDGMWEILESWGRKDPASALVWIDKLDEYTLSNIVDGLAEGWAMVDPKAAAQAGMKFQDRAHGEDFLITVATQWAGSNPQEAAVWAATLQKSDLKANVYMELGTEWAMTDPAAAASWATGVEDSTVKNVAQVGIALGWSEHDPEAAVDWAVANITGPEYSARAIEEIMMNWTEADPNGAARWLNERPQGLETDLILTTFSESIVELDPIAAITWAATMSDDVKRNAHVESLLSEWVGMEGDAARAEILKMDLPENLKQKFGTPSADSQ